MPRRRSSDLQVERLRLRDAAIRGLFYPRPACAACGQPDPEWTKTAAPRAAEEITKAVLEERLPKAT